MNNELLNIDSFKISELPFKMVKVGDLSYFDGSLISVFQSETGSPFIFNWAEYKQGINRWVVFETSRRSLAEYIQKRSTHLQLLKTPERNITFIVDYNKIGIQDVYLISPDNIPNQYLPDPLVKFEPEDSVGLDRIVSSFNLEDISFATVEDKKFDVLEEAKKRNAELFNLHIASNNNAVGYGKIYSSILGEILVSFSRLNKATSLNIFDYKGKIPKDERPRHKKGEVKQIKSLAEWEFVTAKAASFSVFLKPVNPVRPLFHEQSPSEKIALQIFALFDKSQDIQSLKDFKEALSEDVLSSFNDFLKEIKQNDLEVVVQYANPFDTVEPNGYKVDYSFDSVKATKTLDTLEQLEYENIEPIELKGRFTAIDTTNYTWKFEDLEEDNYNGKFSENIRSEITKLNLKDVYRINVDKISLKKNRQKVEVDKFVLKDCKLEEAAKEDGEQELPFI